MLSLGCLSAQRLARYLENRLDPDEREGAEEHLSGCAESRDRLVELHASRRGEPPLERAPESLKRAARAIPRRRRRRVRHPSGLPHRRYLAVAASLVAAVGMAALIYRGGPGRPQGPADTDALRDVATGPALLQPLAPDGEVASSAPIEFRWRGAPEAERYTLTVLDALGDIVLRESTPADRLEVAPAATGLEPGASYFWYVSAEMADGTSAQSEILDFSLR